MTYVNGVSQIELLGELCKIIRIGVHVIAVPGLRRATVAPPVVRYDTVAALSEKQHLRVPVVCGQWPAVAEHYRLPFAPVLVVDRGAIFGRNRSHGILSFCVDLK